MTERLPYSPTRREVAIGMAVALCGLASTSSAWAQGPQPPEQEKPGTSPNQKRTSLQEEIHLKSSPQRIYAILLDPKQFAAFTGQPAEIDPGQAEPFLCSQDKSLDAMSSWSQTSGSCRRGALRIGARHLVARCL